jgi:hypothetical protein
MQFLVDMAGGAPVSALLLAAMAAASLPAL